MKALVRPVSTIAPMNATPREEPSCWPVNCSPPASLRPDSSTEDWITLPSWEIIRPIPTPRTAIPMAKPAPFELGIDRRDQDEHPDGGTTSPVRTIVRTGKRFDSRAPSRGGQEHGDRDGQHLDAGLQSVEAEHELQIQRHDEEDAHEDQVLAEQPDHAGPHRRDPGSERWTSGSRRRLPVALPHEGPQQNAAGDDDEDGQ